MPKKPAAPRKTVETITHDGDSRKNIPTAEFSSVVGADPSPVRVAYERRNRDLDPQLVWRGKTPEALAVPAPPLYIQEKVHPKALIDDLLRQGKAAPKAGEVQLDLFADFNGMPAGADKTDFYQHDQHWANRMILGDSLQVMASLAEREGLRGKVQCVYFDPPYGIKFNSNFQWSTTSRDVKDGHRDHITREPEQVKAFRDTWRDGIHSYLTYLRDRLIVARDLLTDSGSIFVQIGDENVHRVRAVMEEVFGEENFGALICVVKTAGQTAEHIPGVADYIIWFFRNGERRKLHRPYKGKGIADDVSGVYRCVLGDDMKVVRLNASELDRHVHSHGDERIFRLDNITSQSIGRDKGEGAASWFPVLIDGRTILPSSKARWKTNESGMQRLVRSKRVNPAANSLTYIRYLSDFRASEIGNVWVDMGTGSFTEEKIYVVQTATKIVQRCILMATDPGDLVLDPTCGSGTTATVAEQWGRRWITIDTSRVALALARARLMGARYPYYLLADSRDGQKKEADVTRSAPATQPVRGDIRQGFVYERVPHITLKSIANNAEIDVIWDQWQQTLEPLREKLNKQLKTAWHEWEVPREAEAKWGEAVKKLHAEWWAARVGRQRDIDASIAAKAEFEFLYDKPYEDKKKVRVAGPFTVESLSPHRTLGVDENDALIDPLKKAPPGAKDFAQMVLDNLRTAGVQQAHKEDRITFTSLAPWPGDWVCAEGRYLEGDVEKRAAIFIGPEFGTVQRQDLVEAAKAAGDGKFDVLIACAFNYEARTTDFAKVGRLPVLKARMNADLHMAADLKNTGKGNLFVIFGEPDITLLPGADGRSRVKINGVDVFHPNTGEVRSDGPAGIACWFLDTDYDGESFFVRHAYFLGANDPYKSLKTTLKAEINEEAWAALNSDTSRPFEKPASGRIAVKVINHLGDEVMKVFKV